MTDTNKAAGHEAVGGGRRLEAILALALGALALVAVLAFMRDSWGNLFGALLGAAVAVTGGWVFVANRSAARVLGGVLAAVGVVVLLVAFLRAGQSLLALLVALALGAISAHFASRATRREVTAVSAADLGTPRPPAQHPVLIMNPKSGGGKATKFKLEEECRARGIEPVVLTMGDDMVQLAEDAVARGCDVIGMAGGDGSQALVATVAMKHGIPHVVIPAGTRNHLALDLGLDRDDVVGALDAFSAGIPRTIDLATVNGRVFVNNASLGLYAEIVASDAYRDAKLRTSLDTLPDLLGRDSDSLDLHFVDENGTAQDSAQVVLVSNNPYELDKLNGAGTRERMDTGQLGVLSLTLNSAMDARRFLALETAGQVRKFHGWQEWSTPRFEITSSGPVQIGVDGEALTMDSPVVFEMIPAALTVLLPPSAPGRSPAARRLSANTPKELWALALGRG